MTREEWGQYFSSHWNFNGVKQAGHIAMFPEELPKRLIKMFSFVGETVFDPFAGSGTTSLAAKNLGRNSIGYEINEEFEPIIREKLGADQIGLDDAEVVFTKDEIGNPQKPVDRNRSYTLTQHDQRNPDRIAEDNSFDRLRNTSQARSPERQI